MATSADEFRWTWKFYENSPKPAGWVAYDTSRYDKPHKKQTSFQADGRVHVKNINVPNNPLRLTVQVSLTVVGGQTKTK